MKTSLAQGNSGRNTGEAGFYNVNRPSKSKLFSWGSLHSLISLVPKVFQKCPKVLAGILWDTLSNLLHLLPHIVMSGVVRYVAGPREKNAEKLCDNFLLLDWPLCLDSKCFRLVVLQTGKAKLTSQGGLAQKRSRLGTSRLRRSSPMQTWS